MSNEKPIKISRLNKPFSAAHQSALDALMNLMIPASRDNKMPAAASLGLFNDLHEMPQAVREHFERGLQWLEAQAQSKHARAFAELSASEAIAIVDEQRSGDPAFINAFTLHTCGRYLQHDQVMTALGLEARPHWPEGHQVAEGDWGLLDPVRKRGPIWREV